MKNYLKKIYYKVYFQQPTNPAPPPPLLKRGDLVHNNFFVTNKRSKFTKLKIQQKKLIKNFLN